MRAVMLMYDTLTRNALAPYGGDPDLTPNFNRLARRTLQFNRFYGGSMPCMPARRELHTGRYNFLHRGWGPLEPFDDSVPRLLNKSNVHSHLVSDHYHYWEAGGATYHTTYSTWESVRGQEGDPWKGTIGFELPQFKGNDGPFRGQDFVNREYMYDRATHPQCVTFRKGLEFIENNRNCDNWFLQLETFDPHEPFYSLNEYRRQFTSALDSTPYDWPQYGPCRDTSREIQSVIENYRALLALCDENLGQVLDHFDTYALWQDTMLIVNTDHGFLLGEHDQWGKCVQPFYEEIIHTPFFLWDPRAPDLAGTSTDALAQTIDIPPTILDFFGINTPERFRGKPLPELIRGRGRDAALFGIFGGHVNITDGRYVYMRAPENYRTVTPFEYTLMPTEMRRPIEGERLRRAELSRPFVFSDGYPLLKIPGTTPHIHTLRPYIHHYLFDLYEDPQQIAPMENKSVENRMTSALINLLKDEEAPRELYERLGL